MKKPLKLPTTLAVSLLSSTAWSQLPEAPAIMTITPEASIGQDFGDQSVGTSASTRSIDFSIQDFLSGGATNLVLTIEVTSTNSDFVVDDSGCSAVASMPSFGIPCSVSVQFSPTSPGPAVSDLIVTCTYVDVFSQGILSPPTASLAGCRPETAPLPVSFPGYLLGVGIASVVGMEPAKPVPVLSPLAIGMLSMLVALMGWRSARPNRRREKVDPYLGESGR